MCVNMEQYLNLRGNSNVRCYSIGAEYIDVVFGKNSGYRYSYNSAGQENVEHMKDLARQGYGLNSYIMKFARLDYERKFTANC